MRHSNSLARIIHFWQTKSVARAAGIECVKCTSDSVVSRLVHIYFLIKFFKQFHHNPYLNSVLTIFYIVLHNTMTKTKAPEWPTVRRRKFVYRVSRSSFQFSTANRCSILYTTHCSKIYHKYASKCAVPVTAKGSLRALFIQSVPNTMPCVL